MPVFQKKSKRNFNSFEKDQTWTFWDLTEFFHHFYSIAEQGRIFYHLLGYDIREQLLGFKEELLKNTIKSEEIAVIIQIYFLQMIIIDTIHEI